MGKKNLKWFPVCFIRTVRGRAMTLDSCPRLSRLNFCTTREQPDASPGFSAARPGWPRVRSPDAVRGVPAWPTPWDRVVVEPPPGGPSGTRAAEARREGRVGEQSGPRHAAGPPRPPLRRGGGSRTYHVGLLRPPGVTAGRPGARRRAGGGAAAGGMRREMLGPFGTPNPFLAASPPVQVGPWRATPPRSGFPSHGGDKLFPQPRRGRVGEWVGGGRGPARLSVPAPRQRLPAPPLLARPRPPLPTASPGRPAPPPGWRFLFPQRGAGPRPGPGEEAEGARVVVWKTRGGRGT